MSGGEPDLHWVGGIGAKQLVGQGLGDILGRVAVFEVAVGQGVDTACIAIDSVIVVSADALRPVDSSPAGTTIAPPTTSGGVAETWRSS